MTNGIMNTTSQFKDLNEFLAKHSAKNNENNKLGDSSNFTHTRIGDKNLNIYAGSYIIPQEDKETFYKLYYESVFEKKRKEYLTEKQLESGGPMVVDFDFRYNHDVSERKHSRDHVRDMICVYLDELKEYFIFEESKTLRHANQPGETSVSHQYIPADFETRTGWPFPER
jgi:hypothetical protein